MDKLELIFFHKSKTFFWTIGSALILFTTVLYTFIGSDKVAMLSFLQYTYLTLAVLLFIHFIIIIYEPDIKNNDGNESKKHRQLNWIKNILEFFFNHANLYALILFINLLPALAIFKHKPILGIIVLLILSSFISLINTIITGQHQKKYDPKTIFILGNINLENILSFKSSYSENNPDKSMAAREAFVKSGFFGLSLIFICSYITYGEKSFDLTFEQVVISLDSSAAVHIANSKFSPSRNDSSSTESTAAEKSNLQNTKKETEDKQVSVLEKMSEKFEKNINSPAEDRIIRGPTSVKLADYEFKYINFFVFKVLITLTLLLIIAYYWNSNKFAQDYIDKWKILNQQLIEILTTKDKKPECNKLKIKICIDLLDMKMWGHKTFKPYFITFMDDLESQLSTKNIDNYRNSKYDDLKIALHKIQIDNLTRKKSG